MQKRFRVIDTHQHVLRPVPELETRSGWCSIESLLGFMERGGVDKGFLISYNAEDMGSKLRFESRDPVMLKTVYSKEYQVNAWKAHQDKFWWITDHIDPLREEYMDNLERDFEMGASGAKLLPIFHGLLPDHPGWMPVYELCQKLGKPIIGDYSFWYFDKYPHYNETAARQKLVRSMKTYDDFARLLDPVFKQFPRLHFSIAHCGTPRGEQDWEAAFSLIARHPNTSCDIAATAYTPDFLRRLVKAVGARKVMYGTDAAYWFKESGSINPDGYRTGSRRWTLIADDCDFLSEDERQLVLAGNAERFIKNELP
jgi:predicted TIM-barrel fold metal-dependent hydrolase